VSKLFNHIAFAGLVDLAEGRLHAGEQNELRVHLLGCPVCTAQIVWLERVIRLMRTDTSKQPPADVAAAVKRLFRPPTRAKRQQLTATLQFDSARTPVALGRRAGAQNERQLLFAASDYLLDLRLVPQGSLCSIAGQVLGTSDARYVELHGSAGTAQAALNDLSEFALPPLPSGIYTLRLQLTNLDITISGLELGR
jgi:hypothetical protein